MTETGFMASSDPLLMLRFLRKKVNDRRLRLFACACARRVSDPKDREEAHAIEVAERSAYRKASQGALYEAKLGLLDVGYDVARPSPWSAAWHCAEKALDRNGNLERPIVAELLRCVVGIPFRRLIADPAWFNQTVANFAQAIYDDRAFERLPLLADALEDAGCHHEDILAHCRGPGPHVRGCWVVDLLLEKG